MPDLTIPWTWNPLLIAWLAVAAYLYGRFLLPLKPRPRQVVAFAAGCGALVVGLLSPVNAAGDRYLFTLHVVTHMLAQVVAPLLMLWGMPHRLVEVLEGQAWWRRRVGSPVLALGAWLLYNGVMLFWHWPLPPGEGLRVACGLPLDLPKQNPFLASLEDVLPHGVGLFFWSVALYPGRYGLPLVVRGLMLATTWVISWLVSFVIGLAGRPLFGTYLVLPRLWGLDPVADQVLGAGLMWVMGHMVFGGLLVLLFWWWVREGREEPGAGEGASRSLAAQP